MECLHSQIARRTHLRAAGIVTLAALAIPLSAWGEWDFRMLSTPDGVWVNEIESLIEDQSGAIWAATWGEGLHRIHKTAWVTFRESQGFVGDWQRCLALDGAGAVWVGTADGICRFQDGVQTVITQENTPGLASHDVTAMLRTQEGTIVFGTEQGFVYAADHATGGATQAPGWKLLAGPDVTGSTPVSDLLQTADGRIWASLKLGGLHVYNQGRWTRVEGIPDGRSDHLTVHQPDGQLWAAHEFGGSPVFRVAPGPPAPVMAVDTGVNCFAQDQDGNLIAGTDSGLYRLQDGRWQTVKLGPEIGEPSVQAILFASDGSLWIGCLEGLIRGTQKAFTPAGPGNVALRGIAADGQSGVGVALTAQNTLQVIRDGQLREEVELQYSGTGGPRSWAFGGNDVIWIRYDDGECAEFNVSSGELLRRLPKPVAYEALAEPYMRLFVRADGGVLFYGNAGVHALVEGSWQTLERTGVDTAWDHISTVAEGPDGTLYFGGYDSVTSWRDGAVEDLETRYQFKLGDSSHTLLVDRDGVLWVGTHGSGVYAAGAGSVRHYTREDGLRSDSVSQLYEEPNGAMWVAYRRRGAGRLLDGHWQNFDLDQGLPTAAVSQIMAFTPDERWFLASSGVPYRFIPDQEPPDTWIVAAPGQVDSHGIASFSFAGWDAWNHTPSRQLRYAARVVPAGSTAVTPPWSPYRSSSTFVTPQLAGGNYRFEVRAVDELGNTDPVPAAVQFTVLPPLWLKPSFWFPLVCAAVFGLFFLVSWLRDFYRLRQSQSALEGVNDVLLAEIERRDTVERALRESEAHLEEAQGLAQIGSWSIDLQTSTGTWSRQLFRMFDVDPADGVPALASFTTLVHPDDRWLFQEFTNELLTTRESQELIFRGDPKRGPLRYFHCRARVVEGENGEARYLSGTSQDITEQRDAERARAELEEKLRHAQKLEAVGRLAGGIAHDFNNILHALLGYCQIARERGTDDSALMAECLEGIEAGGNRASDLVRQLLTFSRRDQVRPSTQHLEPIVNEALQLLRRTLPATIEIRREISALSHPVYADATQVHQVVLNLCTNAAQAMEDHGGVLRLEVSNAEFSGARMLTTGELPAGEYVRLSIHDTGPGIPPQVLERIFDPFFTTKETGRGTGLGLATVHGIVTSLGGGIDVDSSPGQGTTFHVYLRQSAEAVLKEPDVSEREGSAGSGTILVVDDEPSIAKLSKLALQNQGFDVNAFTDPMAALEDFESRPGSYAAVVTDMTMPGITGLVLAERICRLAPAVPVILVSGRLDSEMEDAPYIREVLRKPLPMARLVEAILRHVDTVRSNALPAEPEAAAEPAYRKTRQTPNTGPSE